MRLSAAFAPGLVASACPASNPPGFNTQTGNLRTARAKGVVVLRRKVRRDLLLALLGDIAPCLIGIEACATAHHWARQLEALGHKVRLMPPVYVKAYVKRHKNDAADAEAICEAVVRPTMRYVPIKSTDAQSVLMLHRDRHLLVRQRTAQVSTLRAHLAEFGIIAPKGRAHVRELAEALDKDDNPLPGLARQTLRLLVGIIDALLDKKQARLVSVAFANKVARIAWAVMVREENYRLAPVSA